MVALSLAYLLLFVPRGWVPHDEGMIGQSAERVLRVGILMWTTGVLHGRLSWFYAAVFKVAGIELLTLRWVLFAGASLAQVVLYSILRRYLAPVAAGLISWLALVWSFPNFFAGLPSWWILICALCCLWGFVRYIEMGTIWYAALAGLATGVAIVVKQTGVYLLVALVMSLLYEGGSGNEPATAVSRSERVVRAGVAVTVFLCACHPAVETCTGGDPLSPSRRRVQLAPGVIRSSSCGTEGSHQFVCNDSGRDIRGAAIRLVCCAAHHPSSAAEPHQRA
jgi:hypothetical protein